MQRAIFAIPAKNLLAATSNSSLSAGANAQASLEVRPTQKARLQIAIKISRQRQLFLVDQRKIQTALATSPSRFSTVLWSRGLPLELRLCALRLAQDLFRG